MKNYYELINLFGFDNISAIQELTEDFKDDFAENFHALSFNKSTRRAAVEKYAKNAMQDEKLPEILSDSISVIAIPSYSANISRKTQISEQFTNFFKNQKPVDLYLKESVAVARSIGWKPGADGYILNVDGNIYNWNLVYNVFSCIADPDITKLSEQCYLTPFNNSNGLIIRTNFGIGFVLPINASKCNECKNVNFKHFTEIINNVDAEIIKATVKTA